MDSLLLTPAWAGSDEQSALGAVGAVLAGAGDVEVAPLGDGATLDGALDRLAGRRLVLAGGDSDLHDLVRRMWRRGQLADTPVGLVPLGADAGLAAHLRLPASPAAAAELALTGQPRRLDLIRSDGGGGVVVNGIGIGDGAGAGGVLRALLRRQGWPLHVNVDDETLADGRHRVLAVAIGNGSGFAGAPGMPGADPADGKLDVLVLGPAPGGRSSGPAGTAGERFRLVRRARGRAVTVTPSPGVRVALTVDGEPGTLRARRSWWVEAGAWSVICPARSA